MRQTDERPSPEHQARIQRSKAGGIIIAISGSVFALGILWLIVHLSMDGEPLPVFLILALVVIAWLAALMGGGIVEPSLVLKAWEEWQSRKEQGG